MTVILFSSLTACTLSSQTKNAQNVRVRVKCCFSILTHLVVYVPQFKLEKNMKNSRKVVGRSSFILEEVCTGILGVLMVILFAIIAIPSFCIIFITSVFYVLIMCLFSPPGIIVMLLLAIIYLIFASGCV